MVNVRVIEPTKVLLGYKKRVCAYARVSTNSDEQLNSYSNQISYYTQKICSNEEWEMAGIFTDEGITGTDMNKRDGFLLMLKECRKGRIDKILTKSISRFARNTQEAIEVIRELRMLGISIEFEKENIDTEKLKGDWTIEVLSAMAQAESMSISQNMRWSYKKRMMYGEFITYTAPYGYRLIENKLEIYEEEAKIVKRIFNEYLNGCGTTLIAKGLMTDKIKNYNGNIKWSHSAISRILKNEKYIGDAVVQKSYTTEVLPFKRKINNGEKEKYYIKESHEGIISREDFERVNELIKIKGDRVQTEVTSNCFNKKLKCGVCGSTLCRKKNRTGSIAWRCHTQKEYNTICNLKQIDERIIKDAFIRMCRKLKSNRYILNNYLEQMIGIRQHITNSKEIIELELKIQEITRQNLSLNRLRSKGYIDSAIFIEQNNENNQKIKQLLAQKQSLIEVDEYDERIMQLKKLIYEISASNFINGWNDELFSTIVQSVIITQNRELHFNLIGKLKIKEVEKEWQDTYHTDTK